MRGHAVTISTLNYKNICSAAQRSSTILALGDGIRPDHHRQFRKRRDLRRGRRHADWRTGDDTFYVTRSDQVIVAPGGGVDTIVTYWGGYSLPNNIQNLIVQGDGAYGVGNSLDNVIEAVRPG